MGQEHVKFGLAVRRKIDNLKDKMLSRFKNVSELKSLTYEQFIHELELLNNIFDEMSSSSGQSTIQFNVEQNGPEFLWKATSQIVCTKVHRDTGTVLAKKSISVPRFMRLYADISHQLSAVYDAESNFDTEHQITASLVITRIEEYSMHSESISECCICMDKPYEVVLPCTHGYCEDCIQEWRTQCEMRIADASSSNIPTCPICRQKVDPTSNLWIMANNTLVNHSEMPAVLVGLVDNANSDKKDSKGWSQCPDPSGDQCAVSSDSSDEDWAVISKKPL